MTIQQRIDINLTEQQLHYYDQHERIVSYAISSALKGAGEMQGSEQTPRGRHCIRAKIGTGLPVNAVLVGRRFTGEIYNKQLALSAPDRDWILTRIMWLSGCEPGKNRLAKKDTMRRYIYIHGTPDSEPMGVAGSHGCIRMRNTDIIELFDQVMPGCRVDIVE